VKRTDSKPEPDTTQLNVEIDAALAKKVKLIAVESDKPIKEVVEESLRKTLSEK